MDKESLYERQKIDTNCNDCKFMQRDFDTYKKWEEFHRGLSLSEFNAKKEKGLVRPKAQFQFDKAGLWNYGKCAKLNKDVSFHPNQCMPQNQDCFIHRKD